MSPTPSRAQNESPQQQTPPTSQTEAKPLRIGGADSPLVLLNLVPFNGTTYVERGQSKGMVFGILTGVQGVWLTRADIYNESQESVWIVPFRLTFQPTVESQSPSANESGAETQLREELFPWTGQFLSYSLQSAQPRTTDYDDHVTIRSWYHPQLARDIGFELKPNAVTSFGLYAENANAVVLQKKSPRELLEKIDSLNQVNRELFILGGIGMLVSGGVSIDRIEEIVFGAKEGFVRTLDGGAVKLQPRTPKGFELLRVSSTEMRASAAPSAASPAAQLAIWGEQVTKLQARTTENQSVVEIPAGNDVFAYYRRHHKAFLALFTQR